MFHANDHIVNMIENSSSFKKIKLQMLYRNDLSQEDMVNQVLCFPIGRL